MITNAILIMLIAVVLWAAWQIIRRLDDVIALLDALGEMVGDTLTRKERE